MQIAGTYILYRRMELHKSEDSIANRVSLHTPYRVLTSSLTCGGEGRGGEGGRQSGRGGREGGRRGREGGRVGEGGREIGEK